MADDPPPVQPTDPLPTPHPPDPPPRPLLLFVEGCLDQHFLRTLSALLHAADPALPDLSTAEADGRLIFVPTGGDLPRWASRFAQLYLPEFHVYDREVEPLSQQRRDLVDALNQRRGCIAQLTRKRMIESYLHADAITEATGLAIAVDDETDVPEVLARQTVRVHHGTAWEEIPRRGRRRLRERAKLLLNTVAVAKMTVPRLAQRDPHGEVVGWLATIQRLLER